MDAIRANLEAAWRDLLTVTRRASTQAAGWSRGAWSVARDRANDGLGWVSQERERLRERAAARPARAPRAARTPGARRERASRAEAQHADMGAHIVVEASDDVPSVLGRIDTADDIDVVLVVPRSARALRQPAAWAHIAAYSRRRGVNLRVLAARRDVRLHARDNGLRAAASSRGLANARARAVRVGQRAVEVPGVQWGPAVRGALGALVLGTAVFGACYALPSAEIAIAPPTRAVTETARVLVKADASAIDVAGGVIPGVTLRREISAIVSTNATGRTRTGELPATSEVVFSNAGVEGIEVPVGTRVQTDGGFTFLTIDRVVVEPGLSARTGVRAEQLGSAGNVPAAQIRVLEGFPPGVTVANPVPARGGADREVAAVSQEDIDRVQAISGQVLNSVGVRELQQAAEGAHVFAQTLAVSVIGQSPFQGLDQPADVFLVEFRATVSALAVMPEVAEAYAASLIASRVAPASMLMPGASSAELRGQAPDETGGVPVELVATGQVADGVDASALRGQLTGVRPGTAALRMQEALKLEHRPEVTIKPEWVPWMWTPRRDDRITIVLQPPPPSDAGPASAPPQAGAAGAAAPG